MTNRRDGLYALWREVEAAALGDETARRVVLRHLTAARTELAANAKQQRYCRPAEWQRQQPRWD